MNPWEIKVVEVALGGSPLTAGNLLHENGVPIREVDHYLNRLLERDRKARSSMTAWQREAVDLKRHDELSRAVHVVRSHVPLDVNDALDHLNELELRYDGIFAVPVVDDGKDPLERVVGVIQQLVDLENGVDDRPKKR